LGFEDDLLRPTIEVNPNYESLGSAVSRKIQHHFDLVNRESTEALLKDPNLGLGLPHQNSV
jgi:hypothetical protein